jgi:hypothetical protein
LLAFGVCVLAASAGLWADWRAVAAGVAWDVVLCWGGPLLLISGAGVVYFGLPILDEVQRYRLWREAAKMELDLRWNTHQAAIDRADAHADRYFGKAQPQTRVVGIRVPQEAPVKARVSTPVAPAPEPETDTARLPELPPGIPPAPYFGTAAELLVGRLWAKQPAGRAAMTEKAGKVCSRDEWEAARDRLIGAGIVGEKGRAGLGLIPPWDQYAPDPATGHDLVARALNAPPLPGTRD